MNTEFVRQKITPTFMIIIFLYLTSVYLRRWNLTLYGSHISVRVVCDPYSKIAFSVSFVARRQLKWCSTRS